MILREYMQMHNADQEHNNLHFKDAFFSRPSATQPRLSVGMQVPPQKKRLPRLQPPMTTVEV